MPLRLFVYNWTDDDGVLWRGVAINPELWISPTPVGEADDDEDSEGCLSVPGESAEERESRLRQGIADHYARLAACEAVWLARDTHSLPVLATGHLYAAGAAPSDSERSIHVGNLGQVTADHFPELFDYVALGHLHRPQQVGGQAHIRYCGSPIPLSFSERLDEKPI